MIQLLLIVTAALLLEALLISIIAKSRYLTCLLSGFAHALPAWLPLILLSADNPHRVPFVKLGLGFYAVFRVGFVLKRLGILRLSSRGGAPLAILGLVLSTWSVALILPWCSTRGFPALLLLIMGLVLAWPGRADGPSLLRRLGWAFLPAALVFSWWTFDGPGFERAIPWWLLPLGLSGPVLVGYQILDSDLLVRRPNSSLFFIALAFLVLADGMLEQSGLASHLRPMDLGDPSPVATAYIWVPPRNQAELNSMTLGRDLPFEWPRSIPNAKRPGEYRIFAAGGSATAMVYVEQQNRWPEQLGKDLGRCGSSASQVINVGIDAWGSFRILLMLRTVLVHFEPDMLLLYIGVNDSNRHEYVYRELWDEENWRWKYSLFNDPEGTLAASALAQGLCRIVEGVHIRREKPIEQQQSDMTLLLEANLRDIKKLCDRHGIRMVIVSEAFTPSKGRNLIYERLADFAEANEVSFFDMHAWFASRGQQLFEDCFIDNVHPNEHGGRLMAQIISNFLVQNRLVPLDQESGRR
ncbi:MAG: SGNH/GDSL hydrolase family protein [Candidatus Alcyoniella australis]|nr:SGNH/GDSL hydrolase family protein [Candidatus Alcyoniella australis]